MTELDSTPLTKEVLMMTTIDLDECAAVEGGTDESAWIYDVIAFVICIFVCD